MGSGSSSPSLCLQFASKYSCAFRGEGELLPCPPLPLHPAAAAGSPRTQGRRSPAAASSLWHLFHPASPPRRERAAMRHKPPGWWLNTSPAWRQRPARLGLAACLGSPPSLTASQRMGSHGRASLPALSSFSKTKKCSNCISSN